ncbi:FHA domain-containing protein [Tautonia plasticadhaerens]|uniref:FHA domain protein n=1 Tax=Tautonia plasticadhaerens TaxID=2527974 RepID=A0A518H8V8_9BACT|nr:FHA domain-containing protein [Tautonia plasticadhaerens]QDV37206.1 FHA domain protein [Tautonia plasticadhaerens]
MPAAPPTATESRSFARTVAGNARQAYAMAVAGAMGAVVGLYVYAELLRPYDGLRQSDGLWWARNLLAGASIGGSIGFFLNAVDPLRDGAPLKLARSATWGALAGAAGGMIGLLLGEVVLGGLRGGPFGRAVAWAILGLGIGVSQGMASRSRQRLAYGVIGGTLGGLVGGFLFESLREGLGNRYDLSQGVGVAILGAGLGLFLALVEQALRRAWVQVQNGRQEGRSYLLATRVSRLGLDERAEVGLFGDSSVARRHAEIERDAQGYVLRNRDDRGRTRLNGRPVVGEERLKDGDRVELGRTTLVFRSRS